ncbi:hypothetical protein TNCV_2690771 [Trichonephila clavipes]|uniref:Uncharacterized protein n=1 Tax=Trichonephila clavipes TaxID=2585209 RepID=A0A8X7BA96_TRICX|nr:hypothetical protein TNCV_2690771 [Trichonephila clavipes]
MKQVTHLRPEKDPEREEELQKRKEGKTLGYTSNNKAERAEELRCYSRAFGDEPRHFEHWSRATPELSRLSPNFHTTPTEGRLIFGNFNVHRTPTRYNSVLNNQHGQTNAITLCSEKYRFGTQHDDCDGASDDPPCRGADQCVKSAEAQTLSFPNIARLNCDEQASSAVPGSLLAILLQDTRQRSANQFSAGLELGHKAMAQQKYHWARVRDRKPSATEIATGESEYMRLAVKHK